ncbi:hypothetical protein Leryth_015133 [Lithospermum erythrorhizon]|nr:hypothetical protein Leryth_015133 [Lithospermum erythrorhizon]
MTWFFAGRPHHKASRVMCYGQSNISFGQYGPYWRNMQLCAGLLSQVKINSYQAMRTEQIGLTLSSLRDNAVKNDVHGVNLSAKIGSLSADMICLMVFGKKFNQTDIDPRGFKALIQEILQIAVASNLGDYFPYLNFLDFQGSIRRMKELAQILDVFLEQIIEECLHQKDVSTTKKARSFVDIMMSIQESRNGDFQFERHQLKSVLLDMFVGGTDTSGTAIEWTLSELLRHPQVMKNLQKELEEFVGMNRMVEESDLEKLEYLDMVIKESLRLHPPGPLLIPHESLQDCTVDGFHIPNKSRIIVNIWAIGRDPKVWPEPEKFDPERFVGSRSCPGMQLGLVTVRIVVAQLVHCFDWELPNGLQPSDVDMEEEFGLAMGRAKPLMAIPTYRWC